MTTLPMGPADLDVDGVRAGDRNLINVRLSSGGAPLDITGATVTSQVRATPVDAVALDAVVTVTNAAQGWLTVRWPGTAIRVLVAGQAKWVGVWDLQVQWPGDDPLTILAGKFTAVMDVTRAGAANLAPLTITPQPRPRSIATVKVL